VYVYELPKGVLYEVCTRRVTDNTWMTLSGFSYKLKWLIKMINMPSMSVTC